MHQRIQWMSLALLMLVCASAQANELFVDSGQLLGNGITNQVALGDVDGDGDLDAVTGSEVDKATIWLNDGSAIFTRAPQTLSVGEAVELADLNQDGLLDVLVGGIRNALVVWWNDGMGGFTSGEELYPSGVLRMAIGDMDGDGRLDLYLGRHGEDQLLMNEGQGSFLNAELQLPGGFSTAVAIGDLDGDSDLDVVAAGWDSQGAVLVNDGHGGLTEMDSLGARNMHAHAAGLLDYEGDGDLDVFFATAYGRCCQELWLNDGAGDLSVEPVDFGTDLAHGITVADVNADGWDDVLMAVGNLLNAPSRLWLGGEGGFVDSGEALGSQFSLGIAAGDLDHDGDIDLFIARCEITPRTHVYTPLPDQVWLNTTND